MRVHRKILEEGDETRLASDVTDGFTEFSNGSHVLLQPVTYPKDRLHTRRIGSYLIVHISRIVPFLLEYRTWNTKSDGQDSMHHLIHGNLGKTLET